MANVFILPGLLTHIRNSIIEGIPAENLQVKDSSLKKLIQRYYASNSIKLWGFKDTLKGLWKKVKPEDYALFYHGGEFPYVGKISFLYPFKDDEKQAEEAEKIAEKVWGKDPRDGKAWSYLMFIYDVREMKLPLGKFNELTGYKFEAKPGKAVMRSIKLRKEKAQKLLTFIDNIYQVLKKPSEVAPTRLDLHEEVVQRIYELGEIIGYIPEKKWRKEGYVYDVVWHKPPREGPKCVFEVHVKGNLEKSLLSLKHANDRWDSHVFLVSTEDQINEAKRKYLVGALHELAESGSLILVKIEEIEEFYRFKGKFEWLERKFGLKPR